MITGKSFVGSVSSDPLKDMVVVNAATAFRNRIVRQTGQVAGAATMKSSKSFQSSDLLKFARATGGWAISARTQTKLWGAVFIALAVAWSTYLLGPDNSRRNDSEKVPVANSSTEVQTPKTNASNELAASRIRFADWQRLIKTPGDDATRRSLVENYRGETVTWEGYLDQINEISPENGGSENQRFLLCMYESESVRQSNELGRAPALCALAESFRDQVATLRPGQRVIVKGTLAAPETLHGSLIGTRLYNCELQLR